MSDEQDNSHSYVNVRDHGVLGPIVGQRVLEVTQQDPDEFAEKQETRIYFHFENGYTVSFPIDDAGFDISPP